ncbi:coatomer subunit gamma-2 isoform 6-T7 [Amazona ochrocephala]
MILTKDMTGKEDVYRGPAIRALCRITDATMLQAIERYMKQAIVDKVPSVSSSALVSSLHMMKISYDVVKRWINEAQEAASSDNIMVQYHALGLLYHLRKNDRLAVSKMLNKFTKSGLKSQFAYCMLIRIASRLLRESEEGHESPLFDFIESCLRNKHEMVIYEAASAIIHLPNCTARELAPAVSVLQLFCSSPKPVLRYAAVRTLNKVAMKHPSAVTACNLDLENLITDSNRSIATLAITTLLKTGSESSVDRLMKQISSFVSEISDEFKVVVVQAISALCQKYPRKHSVMMTFLSNMLRDDGGFEYKRAIVDCIIGIIEENPESKEAGLAHLCEFIEDCEHTVLATKILHLLGKEGPRTPSPSKYIRFIFNRVVLENEAVRAAAVSALAKFGAQNENLLPSILVLLQRCMIDSDDEVRDRATFYLNVLQQRQIALNAAYIFNGLTVSVPGMEKALHQYTLEPSEKPFDMKTVPLATAPIFEQKAEIALVTSKPEKVAPSRQDIFQEQLAAIPEFKSLGPLFKSSEPVHLTEAETEYFVCCVKHVFTNHIVFQFDCTNTLNDQLLERITVQMEPSDAYDVICFIPAPSLAYNQPGMCYTLVQIPQDDSTAVACTFSCTMKFTVRDCDPNTGVPEEDGYDDEYVLEDLEVTVSDHIQKVLKPNFAAAWEEVGDDFEKEETFALSSIKTLDEAVNNIIKFLGMQPCERSDKVPENKNSHTLYLAGVYRGGCDVLVRSRLALGDGVTMQYLTRRIPQNPKYQHIKTCLDTGCSLTKYTEKLEEIKRNYRYKKDELFKRLKVTTFAQLVIQVASLSDETLEVTNKEMHKLEDGDSAAPHPDAEVTEGTNGKGSPDGTPSPILFLNNAGAGESYRSTLQSVISGVGELDIEKDTPKKEDTEAKDTPYPDCPFLLLDVRDRDAYDQCHIIGAHSYPIATLSRTMNPYSNSILEYKNAHGKIIILYDNDERLASQAATTMCERGFENVFMLSGGLKVLAQKIPEGLITGSLPACCHAPAPSGSARKKTSLKVPLARAENRWRFSEDNLQKIQYYLEEEHIPSDTASRFSRGSSGRNSKATAIRSNPSLPGTAGSGGVLSARSLSRNSIQNRPWK